MPLMLLALLVPTTALAFRSVTDGVEDVTTKSAPNLLVYGVAAIGIYAAYKALNKK